MATAVRVVPNTYFDSVALMVVAGQLSQQPGVTLASLVMGTSANRALLAEAGVDPAVIAHAGPNDLIIVVQAESAERAEALVAEALTQLTSTRAPATPTGDGAAPRPRSLRTALRHAADANLVLISTPGAFAAIEAEEALRAGKHVFLFSDNVPLEAEVRLKRLAAEQGLLVMGPDCGTALIGGVGLGFANAVQRGPIGIIAASGTGLQQVSCLIDWLGSGVSHGIGVGSRDLSATVGGATMQAALAALANDPATQVIVLLSKPPAHEVAARVLAAAHATGKPVVAAFLGAHLSAPEGVTVVPTLTAAAQAAVALATGQSTGSSAIDPIPIDTLTHERASLSPEQRFVRGLYSGGTLCEEALWILSQRLGPAWSNVPLDPAYRLPNPHQSHEHTLLDLGDDELTVGRPHPMIDHTLRIERLHREAADPTTAVILLDVVLGYGAHPDPASVLAPAIAAARQHARQHGRGLPIIVTLVGTERDPQRLSRQRRALEEAGALVTTSNVSAAEAAAQLLADR